MERVHHGNIGNDDGLVVAGDLDVVVLTARAVADGVELEPDRAARSGARPEWPASISIAPSEAPVIRELGEKCVGALRPCGIPGQKIGACLSELPQTIVAVAAGRDHFHVPLDELDRRQEALALQAILVEVAEVGRLKSPRASRHG